MVINRRIRRVLVENFAQYTGSLLLIILSCFMYTGMTLIGGNLTLLSSQFENQNAQEDAAFTAGQPISSLAELESAGGALIEEGKTLDYPLSEGVTLRIFSQNEQVNIPAILDGKALAVSGEILLHPSFAAAHNYQIGDTLTLFGKPFTIAGTMALPNYIYPLQADTDIMYSQQTFGVAVISKADFAALRQGSTFYAVKFNQPAADPRAQSAQFRALLESKGIDVVQWTDTGDNKRVSYVTLKIDAINMMSNVMPTTLLLLTSILICTVMARMINREGAIIGALYALGYKKQEILRHYLTFPLAIAAAGGVIGTLLGMLAVRPMVLFMLTAFTIPLTGLEFTPVRIVTSLLLPVVFLGLSSSLVLWSALRHSPVELMKGDQEKTQVNFLERALKLERLNFATKFKIREQLRSLSRLAFLLVGCAAATMLLLYGFTVKSSLDSLGADSLAKTFHFQNEYIYKDLHYEQPPAGVEPFSPALFLPESGSQREFYVNGVLPESTLLSFVDKSGAPLSLNQVVITKPLADNLKLKAGDAVTVIRKLDEQKFTLTIDAIADSYVGKYIFMPLPEYNQTFGLPEGSYLGLWSPGPLNIPQEQLYSKKNTDETLAALKESMATVETMVVTYSTVAFIIGLIVIYLVTSMIIEENKTSISLLKIFGYRKKEVNALILNSSTIVVVIGYAIGVPMILATIGSLLQSLDNSVGITLPVVINPLYIAVGFLVVLLAFEASKLLCRKKVSAISMSEALKAGTE